MQTNEMENFDEDEWMRAKPARSLETLNTAMKNKTNITVFDGSKQVVEAVNVEKKVAFQKQVDILKDQAPFKNDRAKYIGEIAAAVASYRLEGCGHQEVSVEVRIVPHDQEEQAKKQQPIPLMLATVAHSATNWKATTVPSNMRVNIEDKGKGPIFPVPDAAKFTLNDQLHVVSNTPDRPHQHINPFGGRIEETPRTTYQEVRRMSKIEYLRWWLPMGGDWHIDRDRTRQFDDGWMHRFFRCRGYGGPCPARMRITNPPDNHVIIAAISSVPHNHPDFVP